MRHPFLSLSRVQTTFRAFDMRIFPYALSIHRSRDLRVSCLEEDKTFLDYETCKRTYNVFCRTLYLTTRCRKRIEKTITPRHRATKYTDKYVMRHEHLLHININIIGFGVYDSVLLSMF